MYSTYIILPQRPFVNHTQRIDKVFPAFEGSVGVIRYLNRRICSNYINSSLEICLLWQVHIVHDSDIFCRKLTSYPRGIRYNVVIGKVRLHTPKALTPCGSRALSISDSGSLIIPRSMLEQAEEYEISIVLHIK